MTFEINGTTWFYKTRDTILKLGRGKGKTNPLQAWTAPGGSRSGRIPDFKIIVKWRWQSCQPTHRPPLPTGNIPGTHFILALSDLWGHDKGQYLLKYYQSMYILVWYTYQHEYTGCPKKIVTFSKIISTTQNAFCCLVGAILKICAHGNGGYFNQN
jgi:hypothetical protein